MKKVNLLSRAEKRKVIGGTEPAGKCYKCCPKDQPNSSQYSVPSKPGSEPVCTLGVLYETPCAQE